MMPPEPRITINGHPLTEAQAMTVRVALNSFDMDLNKPVRLVTDEHDRATRAAYRQRCSEVLNIMMGG
jgi:hypothetical protein